MYMDCWIGSCGKAGTDFFDIMSLHPGSLIIGNFALKFSPSDFENSLTDSNRRRSSAQWELFSERNKNEGEREHVARPSRHAAGLLSSGIQRSGVQPALTFEPEPGASTERRLAGNMPARASRMLALPKLSERRQARSGGFLAAEGIRRPESRRSLVAASKLYTAPERG